MRSIDLSAVVWRKSSYSNPDGGQCVEVGDSAVAVILVRDSKIPRGPLLRFPAGSWSAFVATVKDGQLAA
ncbi:DUF397 domain-containing protein [Streptomyces sp. NPDC048340]|uniref:DUF397 domain-containing protein n=1 Tax=Streptomyces sp. NPDC048340 TaxID=3365537 RepID=UPI00371EDEAC